MEPTLRSPESKSRALLSLALLPSGLQGQRLKKTANVQATSSSSVAFYSWPQITLRSQTPQMTPHQTCNCIQVLPTTCSLPICPALSGLLTHTGHCQTTVLSTPSLPASVLLSTLFFLPGMPSQTELCVKFLRTLQTPSKISLFLENLPKPF